MSQPESFMILQLVATIRKDSRNIDINNSSEEYDVILKHIWQQLGSSVDKWRRILKVQFFEKYEID